MNITIITPCSRPENLMKLADSISFPCRWIIVYDSLEPIHLFNSSNIEEYNIKGGVSGNLQRNFGIELSNLDDWLYFLDDDNLIHPDFYSAMLEIDSDQLEVQCIVFDQQKDKVTIRNCGPETTKVTYIDQAQYLIKRSLVNGHRFVQDYCADGILIETIFRESPNSFLFINKPLCYYNKLRW